MVPNSVCSLKPESKDSIFIAEQTKNEATVPAKKIVKQHSLSLGTLLILRT